jgi:hypothetical protein
MERTRFRQRFTLVIDGAESCLPISSALVEESGAPFSVQPV